MQYVKPGTYAARLNGVQVAISRNTGNLMVVMNWRLGDGTELKKFFVVVKADGTRMEMTIRTLQRFFPQWDGTDADWFEQNQPLFENLIAELVIVDGEYKGKTVSDIRWINNLRKDTSSVPDDSVVGELPAVIEPNEKSCWRAYFRVHYDEKNPDALDIETWLRLVETTVRGKDRDQFTIADWQRVADELRRRYSK